MLICCVIRSYVYVLMFLLSLVFSVFTSLWLALRFHVSANAQACLQGAKLSERSVCKGQIKGLGRAVVPFQLVLRFTSSTLALIKERVCVHGRLLLDFEIFMKLVIQIKVHLGFKNPPIFLKIAQIHWDRDF
jgi:hypothetical protein